MSAAGKGPGGGHRRPGSGNLGSFAAGGREVGMEAAREAQTSPSDLGPWFAQINGEPLGALHQLVFLPPVWGAAREPGAMALGEENRKQGLTTGGPLDVGSVCNFEAELRT